MLEDIKGIIGENKKRVLAVTLLGLGMAFLANPVYTPTGGAGGGTFEASPIEIEPGNLSTQELSQVPGMLYNANIRSFENLNQSERDVFQTGLDGIYTGDLSQVPQSLILYRGSLYLGNARRTEVGQGIVYQEFDKEDRLLVIERRSLRGPPQEAFETALNNGNAVLDNESLMISGYDYVTNETFYAIETSENDQNETVLAVTQTPTGEAISPLFTPLEEVEPPELRESLLASFEEPQVLSPNVSDTARDYQFVRHEGTLYQMRYEQASVPITEALSPFNFAGMAFGVLLILGGLYMIREVYREQTKKYRIP